MVWGKGLPGIKHKKEKSRGIARRASMCICRVTAVPGEPTGTSRGLASCGRCQQHMVTVALTLCSVPSELHSLAFYWWEYVVKEDERSPNTQCCSS